MTGAHPGVDFLLPALPAGAEFLASGRRVKGWSRVCDAPHPAWDLLRAALIEAYRRNGKNFDMGRGIARLLRDAGLVNVGVRATARVTNASEYYHTFLLTLTSLVRDQIIAGQRVSAEQFDAYTASLRAHLRQPDTLTCQPTMWQAWGTKPQAT